MKKPSPGDVFAQHYRLTHVLGEGSTSLVFAAENVFTGKMVALKWLFPELLREREVSLDLLREAARNGAVVHPNVVSVTDVGRHGGSLFLVMELLQGKPLSVFFPDALVDPSAFLKLTMLALRGVQAAHEAGIVHGSLRPDKIMLCTDAGGLSRRIKVLDFGVAKLTRTSLRSNYEMTGAGTVQSSLARRRTARFDRAPHYLAPEQLRDPRVGDARSDIYALGVIVYRALSGVYPFEGESLSELATLVCDGRAIPLHRRVPRIQRGLCNVVMRTLELEAKQRYQTVADLASALEPYLDQPETAPRRLSAPVEHDVTRPPLPVASSDGISLWELGERLVTRDQARVGARRPASGRMPPPPPPPSRSRPPLADVGGIPQDGVPSQASFQGQDAAEYGDRPSRPDTSTLSLPPLASRAPTGDTEPLELTELLTVSASGRDEDRTASHRIGRDRHTQVPLLPAAAKQG